MKRQKLAILLAYLRKQPMTGALVIVPGSCLRVVRPRTAAAAGTITGH